MACTICNQFQRGQIRDHVCPKFAWQELLQSAKSCYCCGILVSGCVPCFHQHGIRETDVLHGRLRFYYPLTRPEDDDDASKELIFLLKDGRNFQVEFFATGDADCPVADSWHDMPTSQRVSPRSDSPAALATIKGWILECVDEHESCVAPERPELPTRVVDVGLSGETVKLVETRGAKDNYVCLSHCWGLAQIITTTKANIEDHKVDIAWEKLSNTFRDAITFTRALGFRYIWIDSLCIVQDDAKDWEIESSKMASVYSNGHVTLAGTHSADGRGGLFFQTGDIEVVGKTPSGEEYCLYFRERIDHHLEMCEDDSNVTMQLMNPSKVYYPLLTRAWVYQERMLSTRVIHFGHYEVFFECRSTTRCECQGIRYHGSSDAAPIVQMKVEHGMALEDAQDHLIHYERAQLWRTMVAAYTSLYLTQSKDRLPAIGGLARDMATVRVSRYLAGLWEDTLNDDLLWSVTAVKGKKPRPSPPTAPSWSWASVGNTVQYWDEIFFTLVFDDLRPERGPFEHFATIDDCQVTPAALDEFGSIAHGRLRVTGLVAHGVLEHELEVRNDIQQLVSYFVSDDTKLPVRMDNAVDHGRPGFEIQPIEVLCLRMSRVVEGSTDHLISLVLTKSSTVNNTFERIGALVIKARPPPVEPTAGPFGSAKTLTITLV